jgi:hypothetical protein
MLGYHFHSIGQKVRGILAIDRLDGTSELHQPATKPTWSTDTLSVIGFHCR